MLQVQGGGPDVEPQGARGPHSVVGELILLQLTHNVQRALIGHLDAHVVFIRKLLQNGLQLAVFRAGQNAQHLAAAAEYLVGSLVLTAGFTAAKRSQHEKSR